MDLIQSLKKERESLIRRIEAIDVLLGSYNTNSEEEITITENQMSKFPATGRYLEQAIYVIKSKKRFLHMRELIEVIAPYHIDKDKNWLRRRFSSVLSHAKREGKIPNLINITYTDSLKDTVWGSKDWLDNDGKILPEFLFKPKTDTSNKSVSL